MVEWMSQICISPVICDENKSEPLSIKVCISFQYNANKNTNYRLENDQHISDAELSIYELFNCSVCCQTHTLRCICFHTVRMSDAFIMCIYKLQHEQD